MFLGFMCVAYVLRAMFSLHIAYTKKAYLPMFVSIINLHPSQKRADRDERTTQ